MGMAPRYLNIYVHTNFFIIRHVTAHRMLRMCPISVIKVSQILYHESSHSSGGKSVSEFRFMPFLDFYVILKKNRIIF